MAHRVGALHLSSPAVASEDNAPGDPALDVIGAFLAQVLTTWLSTLWLSVAPGEPVVRTVIKDNPEEREFNVNDLPALYLWRDEDLTVQLADGIDETTTQLNVLWVPPPSQQIIGSRRSAFFAAISKALSVAILHEREPSWVHPSDSALPVNDPIRQAAEAYGSDVIEHAGLADWRPGRFRRVPLDIGEAIHPGYIATIPIVEWSTTDNTNEAWGVYPTQLALDITSGGSDPVLLQQALVTGGFSSGFGVGFDGGSAGGFSRGFGAGFH